MTSEQIEALDAIAGRLVTLRSKRSGLGLAVCAVARGDGASLTAAGLATAIAALGYSTVLVDADLEEPGLPSFISSDPTALGLADLLADERVSVADVMQPIVGLPPLSVVHAGAGGKGSADLVSTAGFSAFVADCMLNFEFTIIDTPPANRTTHAIEIVSAVGAAIVVARRDLSYMDDVATLARSISGANATVLGAILIES